MFFSAFSNLGQGFGVALQPMNLLYCFSGVLLGNIVGVLPGMGVLSTISILLPLTFAMKPVGAVLMIAGIYYGAQYGGAICSILLNLPTHPPHAVTCLDGFPMTQQGRGGAALGITMLASFVGASFGITEMIFFAPVLSQWALKFNSADIFSLMVLGLLAGSTLAKGSPLKGISMTLIGLLVGTIGTDVSTGMTRFTFGAPDLDDGVEIVALALGLFGLAEFLKSINRLEAVEARKAKIGFRDMRPTRAELKRAAFPIMRGTLIGAMCSLIPGTGPTIASFVAYAAEKKMSRTPERFGRGMIEGVAAPEAATHSSVQGDFIPTMSLGIPGDATMALLLGALVIQGITPGPMLISEHPDIFWGLIASFWIGNILLILLNVPLIGVWVRLLRLPYKYLYPSALFFICVGVYSTNNSMFEVSETIAIGLVGYLLVFLDFHPAPMLLGFILGPRLEESFRRAMELSGGHFSVFVTRPISAVFLGVASLVILLQVALLLLRPRSGISNVRRTLGSSTISVERAKPVPAERKT